jgi:hypothetical protein
MAPVRLKVPARAGAGHATIASTASAAAVAVISTPGIDLVRASRRAVGR